MTCIDWDCIPRMNECEPYNVMESASPILQGQPHPGKTTPSHKDNPAVFAHWFLLSSPVVSSVLAHCFLRGGVNTVCIDWERVPGMPARSEHWQQRHVNVLKVLLGASVSEPCDHKIRSIGIALSGLGQLGSSTVYESVDIGAISKYIEEKCDKTIAGDIIRILMEW